MRKFFFVYKLALWAVFAFGALLAIGTFARLFIESTRAGEEIFLPGVGALALAVLLFLAYSITRVVKYFRLLKE